MSRVRPETLIPDFDILSYELRLFRKHFLVMNALYQLQDELLLQNEYLSIDPLDIIILPASETPETGLSESTVSALRDYYLDWQHYAETELEDVNALLHSFWTAYHDTNSRQDALDVLGLDKRVDIREIKTRYRQLISEHHPDKGGDRMQFVSIRQAFELLMQLEQ